MSAQRLVGVFGGSFDPIHQGHLGPLEGTRRRLGLDEILFVPAYAPPHKPSGPSATAYHRFAMVALALSGYESFRVSDFEMARGGTTYTVETLRHVRATYPDTEVVLVLGSDTFVTLDTWRCWREILDNHRIAVVYREPYDRAALQRCNGELADRLAPSGATLRDDPDGKTVFWGGNAPVTISSTWLRRAVEAGEDLKESLPPAVEKYLRKQRLYLTP